MHGRQALSNPATSAVGIFLIAYIEQNNAPFLSTVPQILILFNIKPNSSTRLSKDAEHSGIPVVSVRGRQKSFLSISEKATKN